MYFAAAMVVALAAAGFPCFSGLCIPGGVDWKIFLPRLKLKRVPLAKAKVLIVLQTRALHHSTPCLKEIHTALVNGVPIIPVRLELDLPCEEGQWPKLHGSTDIDNIMMRGPGGPEQAQLRPRPRHAARAAAVGTADDP